MTQLDRIEARLPELLSELGAAQVPDYFDDMLRQTAATRQRPAWSQLERWIPMGVIARPALAGVPAWRPILIGGLLLLLIVAGAVLYAGSRSTPLPPPFGPAGNGKLYFADARGDILAMDPNTLAATAVVTGGRHYAWPLPSKDGRFIQFLNGNAVMVANSDGSNVHALQGEYINIAEQDWSPDSNRLGVLSSVGGNPALSILDADGSGATTLHPGVKVHNFWFLPDGRILFTGVGKVGFGDTYAIYVMNPDGTGVRPIVPVSRLEGDYLDTWPSPDGKSVVYHVWRGTDEHGVLYVTNIDSGTSRRVAVTRGPDDKFESPQLSPDGTTVMFMRFTSCCRTLSVAPVAGGSPIDIGESIADDGSQVANALFSPDGKSVIAYYPGSGKLWMLDPSGVSPDRELAVKLADVPTWQRVAAP